MIYLEGIEDQLKIFLYSMGLGVILSSIYDLFKLIRYIFNFKKISLFLLDVFYSLICAILTFLYMLIINSGRVRFYILLGEAIGFLAYYLTFSKLTSSIYFKIKRRTQKLILSFKNVILKINPKRVPIKYFNALNFRFGAKKASENAK